MNKTQFSTYITALLVIIVGLLLWDNIKQSKQLKALEIRSERQTKLLELNNQVNQYNTSILNAVLNEMEKENK